MKGDRIKEIKDSVSECVKYITDAADKTEDPKLKEFFYQWALRASVLHTIDCCKHDIERMKVNEEKLIKLRKKMESSYKWLMIAVLAIVGSSLFVGLIMFLQK